MTDTIKTRILLKTDTTANWEEAINFIPQKGEICIYSDRFQLEDGSYVPGIKVGDGTSFINELKFISENCISNSEIDELYEALNDIRTSTVPNTRKINNKDLSSDISLTAADVGALSSNGTAAVAARVASNLMIKLNNGAVEGTNLFVYNGSAEKTINISPSTISAVPTSRTVNDKALSANISLTASDVSAVSTSATDTQVLSSSLTVRGTATAEDSWKYLGVTRYITDAAKSYSIRMGINSDGSANFLLYDNSNSSTSVNMLSLGLEETSFKKPVNLESGGTGATTASEARTKLGITPENIGAVPTTRKINNKALSADISLTAADVGALASGATATAASKVASNLVIKLNEGTTEGTNLFTFNGSSAKTINITPANIAALPSAGGTITGNLTVNGNITIGTHNPAIKLTAEGFNYIKGTAASSIAFCLNETSNQANTTMFINATGANPGASATYSLGTSSLKWKNLYVSGATSLGNIVYMVGSTDTGWSSYQFRATNGTDSRGEVMISDANRIHFNQRKTGASYAERYILPTVTANLTADVWYNILTTKSVITVAQGGTGATTAKTALKNLGIYYQSSEPSLVEGRIWLKPV